MSLSLSLYGLKQTNQLFSQGVRVNHLKKDKNFFLILYLSHKQCSNGMKHNEQLFNCCFTAYHFKRKIKIFYLYIFHILIASMVWNIMFALSIVLYTIPYQIVRHASRSHETMLLISLIEKWNSKIFGVSSYKTKCYYLVPFR